MAQEAPPRTKIPTKSPQPARSGAARDAGRAKSGRTAPGRMLAGGTGRAATRGGRPVIELECGITVYPAREEQGRWRAVRPVVAGRHCAGPRAGHDRGGIVRAG